MDFDDTPEEAAYRARARAWLRENAPKPIPEDADMGMNLDRAETMARARAWQAKKSDAGYAMVTFPKKYGGGGGTAIESVIYAQEEARAGVRVANPFGISLNTSIPTLAALADDETKDKYVRPAVRGETVWCQLLSEPSGGSDLAAVRTRAVRDGDEWVINGQKIWTTGAHYSDYGIAVLRTNPDAPKHQGITLFWLDMKTPGVEVRPIHQMSGGSGFNEVYFKDVRIPDSQRLCAVDDGWRASMSVTNTGRASAGAGPDAGGPALNVVKLARELTGAAARSALKDQALREKIAEWYVLSEGLRFTGLRALTALSRGQAPGPDSSISKLVQANMMQDLALHGLELQDQFAILAEDDLTPMGGHFQRSTLSAPSSRIAGGTDEILKNVLAERVLGLPQDIRIDKDVPFKDLPNSL